MHSIKEVMAAQKKMGEEATLFPSALLARLWKEARLSALRPYLSSAVTTPLNETGYLTNVALSDQAPALQAVCNESRQLGLKLASQWERPLTLSEMVEFLLQSEVPCFLGNWKFDNHHLTRYLVRSNCSETPALFACDYWREAIRGLVEGLTKNVEYSRHRSLGHGDLECFDVLYTTPYLNRKWGIVPNYISRPLSSYVRLLKESGIDLSLQGYSEGVIFFQLESTLAPLFGAKRIFVITQLIHEIHRRFPEMKIVDVTKDTAIPGTEKGR